MKKYLTPELEKSIIVSFDAVNVVIGKLNRIRTEYPKHFGWEEAADFSRYTEALGILGSWLEDGVDSHLVREKIRDTVSVLAQLTKMLEPNAEGFVTDNQWLCLENYIYTHIAQQIGSNFYSFRPHSKLGELQRSLISTFNASMLRNSLQSLKASLIENPPANYVELERRISDGLNEINAMRYKRYAA